VKTKEKTLIINKAIDDAMVPELDKAVKSPKVEKIIISTKDLCAAALQLLLCVHKTKPIEIKIDDKILKSFFANIKYS